jgi:ectoine hydroxylase-related dioxygenase (phytanoyl-CoA dioxygenase family)
MWFVPGSHRLGLKPHHQIASHPHGVVLAAVDPDSSTAIACPLEIGGATIHHPLTLHYTGANQTDSYRRAWILHFGAYGRLGVLHPKNLAANLAAKLRIRLNRN